LQGTYRGLGWAEKRFNKAVNYMHLIRVHRESDGCQSDIDQSVFWQNKTLPDCIFPDIDQKTPIKKKITSFQCEKIEGLKPDEDA
jgi:hypothetical protein